MHGETLKNNREILQTSTDFETPLRKPK